MTTEDEFDDCDLYDSDEGREVLRFDSPDDAIEDELDNRKDTPETLTVYGFKRRKVEKNYVYNLIAAVLDELNEEFGEPNEYDFPEQVNDAAEALEKAILEHYVPCRCDEVAEREYDVQEWMTRHAGG